MDTQSLYPRFSEDELSRRYSSVRAAMQESEIPLLLVYGTPPFANGELLYLSNYPSTRKHSYFSGRERSRVNTLRADVQPHPCNS